MSTARIGTSTHVWLHDFELAHQRFSRLGIEPYQARRMAMFATLRATGACNTAEAWEIVNKILGPQRKEPTS